MHRAATCGSAEVKAVLPVINPGVNPDQSHIHHEATDKQEELEGILLSYPSTAQLMSMSTLAPLFSSLVHSE